MARPFRESIRHGAAWEYYYSLGENRNLLQVAKRFGVTPQAVAGWSAGFKWQNRLLQREKLVNDAIAEDAIEEEKKSRILQLSICRNVQVRFAQAIKENVVPITAGDFVKVAAHELLLRGKATERSEIVYTNPIFDKLLQSIISVIEKEIGDSDVRTRLSARIIEATGLIAQDITSTNEQGRSDILEAVPPEIGQSTQAQQHPA